MPRTLNPALVASELSLGIPKDFSLELMVLWPFLPWGPLQGAPGSPRKAKLPGAGACLTARSSHAPQALLCSCRGPSVAAGLRLASAGWLAFGLVSAGLAGLALVCLDSASFS